MSNKKCENYINHIEQFTDELLEFTKGMNFKDFELNTPIQKLCIYNILVIGEISSKLFKENPDFIELNPQIPWHAIRNMRNIMIHKYFDIDLEAVWDTIQISLPDLKKMIPSLKISAREFDKNQNIDQKYHLTFGFDSETRGFQMRINNQPAQRVLAEYPEILNALKANPLLSAYSEEQLKSGLLPKIEGKRLISMTIDQHGKEIKSKDLER